MCCNGSLTVPYKSKIRVKDNKIVRNVCPPTTLIVTNVSKIGHPWEHRITTTNQCFAVNGEKGKTLFLKRNIKYTFIFNQTPNENTGVLDHALYFTSDPGGGIKGGKYAEFDPCSYDPIPLDKTPDPYKIGSRSFIITNSFPTIFYYQCRNNSFMGGIIFVIP